MGVDFRESNVCEKERYTQYKIDSSVRDRDC